MLEFSQKGKSIFNWRIDLVMLVLCLPMSQAGQTNPGKQYSSATFSAYLPNNQHGKLSMKLLKLAFTRQQLVRVEACPGAAKDVLVLNGVHFKSSIDGK